MFVTKTLRIQGKEYEYMLPTNQTTLGIIQGIVNKGAVLPIALSIILIVFAVLVMVLIKPNPKYKRTTNRIIIDVTSL